MIITGCNSRPGLMNIIDGEITLLETGDTRGAAYVGDTLFYLTRKGLWRQRVAELAVLIYDVDLQWHGLHNTGHGLLAPDPVSDLIHEFDLKGNYVKPINWKNTETTLHTNDCWREGQDLWLTCFHLGVCKNGEPQGYGAGEQPHSPIRWQLRTYYCSSNAGTVMCEKEMFCAPGGFTRGLLPTPAGLWVGSSKQRHEGKGGRAFVRLYSWGGDLLETIELPTDEVYAIAIPGLGT